MKGLNMYSKIHQLKNDGLKRSQVSRHLGINYKTVCKYWDMTLDEYHTYQQSQTKRPKKLDKYKDDILFMLHKHNDYTNAQILDLLWEKYPDEQDVINYSTLRKYIRCLRSEHNIPKGQRVRHYQAIVDPPMGYQAQVDLGYDTQYDEQGNSHELCAMAMVLSNSRYKYVEWLDRHPVTTDFINFHERAFEYFGGMPEEIVYDQDRLLIVSENFGDIIYTHEFENYRQRRRFNTFICRGSDPETKGRIEAVIKYVKYNFARHRIFTTIEDFNHQTLEWLERTGNAMVHGTTKKVPAEVFSTEKTHLKQVPDPRITTILDSSTIIPRIIRKDNTVEFESNRYSVPLGTYEPGKEVGLKVTEEETLQIVDLETEEILGTHRICPGKGQLIQESGHLRNHRQRINQLYRETHENLCGTPEGKQLLDMIQITKRRYVRDQFTKLCGSVQGVPSDLILKAIHFVVDRELWSADAFASVLENLDKIPDHQSDAAQIVLSLPDKYNVVTEVRDLSVYEKLAR